MSGELGRDRSRVEDAKLHALLGTSNVDLVQKQEKCLHLWKVLGVKAKVKWLSSLHQCLLYACSIPLMTRIIFI